MALRLSNAVTRIIFSWDDFGNFRGGDGTFQTKVYDDADETFVPIVREEVKAVAGNEQPGMQLSQLLGDVNGQLLNNLSDLTTERDTLQNRVNELEVQLGV